MPTPRPRAFLPRRPLVGIACSFLAGSAWGIRHPMPTLSLALALGAAAAALLALRLARTRRTAAQTSAAAATHLAVFAAASFAASLASREQALSLRTVDSALARASILRMAGTVTGEPTGQRLRRGGARIRFDLDLQSLPDISPEPLEPPQPIGVDWYGPLSFLTENPSRRLPQAGEGWSFQGRLKELPSRSGRRFLRFTVRDHAAEPLPDADAPRWRQALWELRRASARQLTQGIEDTPRTGPVLKAMLLGYRSELPYELREVFANSGTIHVFAISGLHVAILASLLIAVLPVTRLPKPVWGCVIVPVLILYTILTGGRPSAQRACVMAVLMFSAPLLRRKPDALSSLAAAAILILIASPFQIHDLGFLFSFACVLAILTITPPLQALLNPPAKAPEAVDAEDLVRRSLLASGISPRRTLLARLRPFLQWLWKNTTGLLAVSLAAWLASTPLTAVYFGRITPIAILSNLYAIPLAFCIVLSGSLSLLAGLVSPWLSQTFNCAAVALVETLVYATRQTVRIPGASVATPPWPPWAVGAWYCACLLLALALHLRVRRAAAPRLLAPDVDPRMNANERQCEARQQPNRTAG